MYPETPRLSRFALLIPLLILFFCVAVPVGIGIDQYNNLQMRDEAVNASWSGVINMYRRRTDLLPNVIAAVQTYAAHEREVLAELAEARVSLQQGLDADSNNPQAIARLAQAQQKFSNGFGHLLVVAERYPDLKANALFQELIVELEGSENRISYARGRFIDAVADYNLAVRRFPGNLVAKEFGFKVRPAFETNPAENVQRAPFMKAP